MIVGITGCPGSGKSILAGSLQKKGWDKIDADVMGKELVENSPEILSDLCMKFGKDILSENNMLDRRLLGKRAFNDKDSIEKLNEIVHPALIKELKKRIADKKQNNINTIVDCALIFEWKIETEFDIIICVASDEEKRIKRIAERDKRSFQDIKKMFGIQMSQEEKIMKSDIVFINNGDILKLSKFGNIINDLPKLFQEGR